MMLLSIGFEQGKCDILSKLEKLVRLLNDKNIRLSLVESDSDGMHFIKCVVNDEDIKGCNVSGLKKDFDIYAANIIYEIIVDNFQVETITKFLKENHSYFKDNEIDEIASRCVGILSGTTTLAGSDYLFGLNMKESMIEKIYEYVSENSDIILEGFIRFRLREFNSTIEDIADRVVEEYLVEREYNEFIKLLKYFVDIQESRIETVNIVAEYDGSYCMYDGMNNEVTEEFLRDLMNGGADSDINHDDLLVSSLITTAPKLIILHNVTNIKNKEMVETIKSVFGDRVKTCPGCSLCTDKVHRI